jgi:hypothetical protein
MQKSAQGLLWLMGGRRTDCNYKYDNYTRDLVGRSFGRCLRNRLRLTIPCYILCVGPLAHTVVRCRVNFSFHAVPLYCDWSDICSYLKAELRCVDDTATVACDFASPSAEDGRIVTCEEAAVGSEQLRKPTVPLGNRMMVG